jgi:DNA-directed RNA polymerase specialized sigma24 family protein
VHVALDELPDTWRGVLVARDVRGLSDAQVATEHGLSIDEERDILTAARAAVRARLDGVQPIGDER